MIIYFALLVVLIKSKSIAIIGCGVGGTYLSQLLKEEFSVTIYESTYQCGGRVDFQYVEGISSPIELGASFLIEDNEYIQQAIAKYGLKIEARNSGKIGIMEDKKIQLETSESSLWNIVKLAYNYGLTPKYAKDDVNERLAKFKNIYEYLNSGKYFKNQREFLKIIKLDDINMNFKEYLNEKQYNQLFQDQFVNAITLSIYNQQYNTINSVAGIISLIAAFNEAYTIEGGNRRIVDKLSENSNIKYIGVNKITELSNGQFRINDSQNYDIIVVAHLLTKNSQIDFPNFDSIKQNSNNQETHVYIISGKIKLKYFGLTEEILDTYMILDSDVSGMRRLCTKCYYDQNVYKLQAKKEIDLNLVFSPGYSIIKYQFWDPAYPQLKVGQEFPIEIQEVQNIQYFQNMYYLNSMEYTASCMEMEMISAKNIANIIKDKYLIKKHDDL